MHYPIDEKTKKQVIPKKEPELTAEELAADEEEAKKKAKEEEAKKKAEEKAKK